MKTNLPKYFQISQSIVKDIKNHKYLPGMKIPSENDIIKKYNVSNTTARKALLEIEKEGWVTKIKGKGTFVKKHGVIRSADRILSFTNNMREMNYKPSTKVLFKGIIEKDYTDIINGRNYTIKGPVYKIHRLRFADDIPMMIETRFISTQLCPGLLDYDLTKSLWAIYKDEFGYDITEDHQMLSTIMLDTGISDFFNLDEPIPGILINGVAFAGREIILEMERSIYRGDKYSFAVRAFKT